jgi:hypothetical protein
MGRGEEPQGLTLAFPYPQKLWITLWMTPPREVPFPGQIAYLLPWSKNDQPFSPFLLNGLRRTHCATWSV